MIAAFTNLARLLVPVFATVLGTGAASAASGSANHAVYFAVASSNVDLVAVTKTTDDAGAMKRAKALLAGLQAGTIDRAELSAALSADYTATVLANAAKTLPKGTPARFEQLAKTDTNGTTTYVYKVGWDAGDVDYVFGFDDATFEVTKLFTRPGPPQ